MKRKNIMHLRVDENLTKKELGEKLGVTGQYIGKIENCKANGSKEFWNKFKEVFNKSDEEIEYYKKIQ